MADFADACHSASFLKKINELPLRTLNLPSSFVRTHGKLLSSKVILEGPSRKQWIVEVDGYIPSLNVTFGQGWKDFVTAHVLQLGDQLCFMLPANSHFQVEVYDESGCQKTSALDATGSNALVAHRVSTSLFSKRPSELQIPAVSEDPVSQTLTSTRPAATMMRLSQIQSLDDPNLKAENLAMYTRAAAEKALNDIQLESATPGSPPLLSRREFALETIPRDSALRGSVRNPYVLIKDEGAASVALPSSNPNPSGWSAQEFAPPMGGLQASVPVDSLSDLTDCFVDMENILAAPPDLTDTEPLVIENLPPCWELHEHTPAITQQPGSLALLPETTTKRFYTLYSTRPPDFQIPPVAETHSLSESQSLDTTTATQPRRSVTPSKAPKRSSTLFSTPLPDLQIPPVAETLLLSEIQSLDTTSTQPGSLALPETTKKFYTLF